MAAFPGAAQARCRDINDAVTGALNINGAPAVSEVPISGTCNANDYYQANFKSNYAGWRASVWIQNNGNWIGHFGAYGTNWASYDYADGNSHSLIHFCLDNGATWYCGWGNNYTTTAGARHDHSGVNQGF